MRVRSMNDHHPQYVVRTTLYVLSTAYNTKQQQEYTAISLPGFHTNFVFTVFFLVKIKYVYIEPAGNGDLAVIENKAETTVCVTSSGRPDSDIKWFRQERGIKMALDGNEKTENKSAPDSLVYTRGSKTVIVSRADIGWQLLCTAVNIDGGTQVEANNSKSLNVLCEYYMIHYYRFYSNVNGDTVELKRNTSFSTIVLMKENESAHLERVPITQATSEASDVIVHTVRQILRYFHSQYTDGKL